MPAVISNYFPGENFFIEDEKDRGENQASNDLQHWIGEKNGVKEPPFTIPQWPDRCENADDGDNDNVCCPAIPLVLYGGQGMNEGREKKQKGKLLQKDTHRPISFPPKSIWRCVKKSKRRRVVHWPIKGVIKDGTDQ